MSFTTPVDDIGTTNQAYESEPDNPLNVRRKTATAAHYNSPAETLSELQTSDSDLTHSPNFRNHPVKIISDFDDEATTRRRQRSCSRGGYHDRTPEMMPLPPNKGAPKKFRGDYAYVRKFLKQYVQLCRAYNVTSEQEKCEKLLDYDWDELEKDLLHYYDAERVDTRYALKDLVLLTDKWAKKDMSDLATYKRYSIEFHTIAGWLVIKDMLTIRHRDGHFFRGIKRGLREKLEERYINQNRGATLKDPIPIAAIDKMIENQFNRHSYHDELEDTLTSRKHQSKSRRDRDYDYDSDSDDSESEQAPGDESDTEDSDEEDSNDGRQNKRHIREGKKKLTKRRHSKSRRDEDNNPDREDPSKSSHHSKKPHKTYDESEDEEDDSKHNKSSRHSRKNHKTYDSARDEDDRKVERLVKERLAEEDQKATRGRTRSDSVPDTASSKSKSNKRVPDAAELDALIDKMRTMEITDPRYQGLYMQAYLINPVIAKIVKQPPNPNEVPQQPRRNMFNGGGPRQYQTMQVAQQTPAVQSVQTGPPLTGPNLIPVAGNGYQGAPATMQSFQEEGCFGCGLGGHMLRNCQRVNDLIMEGLVTRDDLGRLRYLNGNLVRRINGLYLADSVVRTINSQAPALSTFLAEIDEASNRTMQVNWAGESYPAQVYAKTDKQAGTGREAREKVNDRSRAPPNSTSAIGREIRAENRPIQGHVHQPQPVKVVPKPVSPDNAMTQRPAYRSENPVPVPREGLQTRGLKPALVPMDKTAGQSPQQAELRPPADPVPEPIPFDARKTRFVPTDDVVMKEVNNGHVSSNEAWKRNPRQSELQRRVDVKALMRKILKTPIAVTMEEYLGTSREMAEEVTKLLRFKNAKSLTDDEAVLLTALQAEMYYPEQEDYYGDDESDDSDYPDISNPTSNIAMSREMTLPEGRDRAPLITIMFECQGKPINAILDSGSMLNIVREDVFAASIRYPKKAEERITMRDANGNDGELVGLSRSVRLDIGTISTRANLHIGSTTLPYQMLLGRPYMLDNKVSIDERDEGTFVIFEPDGQDRWELFTNPAELMRVHTVDTQMDLTGYGGCYAVLDAIIPGSPKMLQDDFTHTMESEEPEARKVRAPDDSEKQELSDKSSDSQTSDSDLDSDTESESESDGESESETDEENDDHSLPNKDENTARCSTPTLEPSSWILSEHWQEEWPEAAEGTLPNTVETLQYLKSRLHKMAMKINNEWHAAPRLRSISVKTQQDGTAFSVEWGTEWRIYKIGEIYAMRSDLIELMKQARTQEFEAFHLNEMDSEYSTSSLGDELWTWKLKNYSKLEPRAYKTVDFNEAVTQNNESIQSRMLHGRLSISAENNKLYFGGKMDVANHFRAQIGRIAHQMQHVWNFDHPDRQIHIWTTKDHTEIGVVIEVSKEEPTTEESIARDNKELQYLITDACHDVFANDLAQEGKETYNAETGELEFKWRPKPEVYDNSEPPLHDKIAQWMGKKSWVTDCWEDLVETAMSRTQIMGEAPALSENGYADTTKIEPPLIFWDERHYFGIYQDDEIYLIPEGRFGLVIAEEFHEEMMDQSIKFLTGVDVMIDGQSVKMDFISQQTKGGFKFGRLWGDKLEEILETKQVVLAIKARLTKEEAVMAILRPKDTFSTISQALVKRTRGEERLCSAEFSTTGKYIQIRITYQDETVTIAALIVPTSERGCEVTLGNNWVDQTKRCVICTVTVTKPEVSIAATSLADGCTVPSPVFMIDPAKIESTPDAQFSDKDSDPESYFKGLEQIAPQIIPAAPIASHHFLKVLKDLENYWLQLAQFEALIRAQGYQLIIAKHEGKLNPGFQMEETTKLAETKEIHSRESIVEAPTKTDTLTTEFHADSPTKLEATEGPEAIQIRPNEEISGSGLAHRVSSEDLGPCVLCPRGFKLGLRKMTASEQAQAESNLETRRRALLASTSTINSSVSLSDEKTFETESVNTTSPDLMSETLHGSAANQPSPPSASKAPLDVELTSNGHKVDTFYRSAYWVEGGEQRTEGIWLEPVSQIACSVTRSPFTKEGALYEPVFRTISTGDTATGELVVHSLAGKSRFGLFNIPAKETLIFGATLANRSHKMGEIGRYEHGFVVVFGHSADGIRKLIPPKHGLYPRLQDCILRQVEDDNVDSFATFHANNKYAFYPSQPPNLDAYPPVELVADVVRLHELTQGFEKRQRKILRQDTILMIREYQEKAIGSVLVKPGPNHMPQLVSELVRLTIMVTEKSQRQTHTRASMRANPAALRYVTKHLPPDEAEAFVCLASVQLYLHGIDSLQDFQERLRVTQPLAHLDQIIRLTMEIIDEKEVTAPNFMEREFQWYCEFVHKLEPSIQTEWAGLALMGHIKIQPCFHTKLGSLASL
ncbi:hypothetical protein C8J56DRAFT_1068979 [Mycena floridula]|nr:hypothetical protein C8J56DRAFT_1068979 [Mycena floridula]